MTKKLTAKQQQTRAKKAEKILSDKLVQETFELVELSVFDLLKKTQPSQEVEREYFHMLLRVCALHKDVFSEIIRTGQKIDLADKMANQPSALGDLSAWRQKRQQQAS